MKRPRLEVVEETSLPGLLLTDRRYAKGDPDRVFQLDRHEPFVAIDPGRDGAAIMVPTWSAWTTTCTRTQIVPLSDAAVLMQTAAAWAAQAGVRSRTVTIVVEGAYIGTIGGKPGAPRGVVLGQIAQSIGRAARTGQIVGALAAVIAANGNPVGGGVHLVTVSPSTWQSKVLRMSSREGRDALKAGALTHAAAQLRANGLDDETKVVRSGIADAWGVACWWATR